MMSSISVVIATRNEEARISLCLESVTWADEIVIVDDQSTDKTCEICRQYTDKIFVRDSKGSFHENKNFAIEQASKEWILTLDADEIIPQDLAKEIRERIQGGQSDAYFMNRRNYFLNQWIKGCGWYPDKIIRIFRKGVTSWPLEIHDTPHVGSEYKVGCLEHDFIHYSYRSFDHYFSKFNQYTSRLAEEEAQKGRKITAGNFVVLFFLKPIYWFLKKYFWLQGFRDGLLGFFISFSSGLTIFTTHAKLWELQKKENDGKR